MFARKNRVSYVNWIEIWLMKVWLRSVCGPLSLLPSSPCLPFPPLSSQLINIRIFVKYFMTQTLILDYVLSCLQKTNNLPGIASSTMCSLWRHLIFENNELVRVENSYYFLGFFHALKVLTSWRTGNQVLQFIKHFSRFS